MNGEFSPQDTIDLVEKIRPLLAGHDPRIQGAALADLLAIWLAGHVIATPEDRDALLALHIEYVRQLVPINQAILAKQLGAGE